MLAPEMRAGEPELVAQEIRQGHAHLGLGLVAFAVDRQRDLSRLTHRFTTTSFVRDADWIASALRASQ
jgi:hypothetical protein